MTPDERLRALEQRRAQLVAAGAPETDAEVAELDRAIAEARETSLLGHGAPRPTAVPE